MPNGFVSSVQSLGTVDGPGVRFVAFMQGCNLRCGCCHNPETWEAAGGEEYTPLALYEKASRFREYFGDKGGVTLSGGEPLLQADFAAEYFSLCRQNGINTCLDTSGSILNDSVQALLDVTDRVLLDIKYTEDWLYRENVGCGLDCVLAFLRVLDDRKTPTVIRQVIIPTLNDNGENLCRLADIVRTYKCVEGVELLPFKKLCSAKYDNLGLVFRFKNLPTPSAEDVKRLQRTLDEML